MFDLPVVLKAQRKAANRFRHDLKDLGFEMAQLSVYMRYCTSVGQMDALIKKIESLLPPQGKVKILQFTDKQYSRIISFRGEEKEKSGESPQQLLLL
jgi:CRISPR-associated protein Cas2